MDLRGVSGFRSFLEGSRLIFSRRNPLPLAGSSGFAEKKRRKVVARNLALGYYFCSGGDQAPRNRTKQPTETMKTIRTLTANLDGILERSEHGIEACATADTGWGIMTPGDPLPINRSESTEVLGWGDIDGPAAVVGAVRVPLSQL